MKNERKKFAIDGFHTFILVNFAVAQPLFNILSKNTEFFIARNSQPIDILLMVCGLCLLLPLIVILFEAIIRLINRKLYSIVHFLIFGILVACILLPLFTGLLAISGLGLVALSLVVGLACAIANERFKHVTLFFTILSPALVIFPAVFLLTPQVLWLVWPPDALVSETPEIDSNSPVIVLIFDELPIASLMDEKYEIDSARYPNFAALANDSYWFRNATTVSDDTVKGAVPAIVTGLYPDHLRHTMMSGKRNNIFTFFSKSYNFNVFETYTQLCPKDLCEIRESLNNRMHLLISDLSVIYAHIILPSDISKGLPNITQDWKNFHRNVNRQEKNKKDSTITSDRWEDRPAIFRKFIAAIKSSDKPLFAYLHVLLPHIPWTYLPSGERYYFDVEGFYGVPGVNSNEMWSSDPWPVIQGWQRHLIQLEYVDKLMGLLIQKLKDEGMYDRSVIVVTADHGVAFVPDNSRRMLTEENVYEIASIPLFMKAPNQKKRIISDRNVETIDILPTIANMLKTKYPGKMDGASALDESKPERKHKILFKQNRRDISERLTFTEPAFKGKFDVVDRKVSLFGSGTRNNKLYTFGPYQELIGKGVNNINVSVRNIDTCNVILSTNIASVDVAKTSSPLTVTGQVQMPGTEETGNLILAISINDTISAVTKAHANSTDSNSFLAFVSEQFLQDGSIRIGIYAVQGPTDNPKLYECNIATDAHSR